jgi:uncharacterized membrane protein
MKNFFTLKFALGVSIFVNLFLAATVFGALFIMGRHFHDLKQQMPREMVWRMKGDHDPARDQKIFDIADESAGFGEADIRQAMKLRAEALKVAQVDPFDKAKVLSLNTQARAFENAAREKVETAMIEKLADQPHDLRVAVMGRMLRPGFRHHALRRIEVEKRVLRHGDDDAKVETHVTLSEGGADDK